MIIMEELNNLKNQITAPISLLVLIRIKSAIDKVTSRFGFEDFVTESKKSEMRMGEIAKTLCEIKIHIDGLLSVMNKLVE